MPTDFSVSGMIYWRIDPSLEAFFAKGRAGGMFFLTYTRDDTPLYKNTDKTAEIRRFSKNGLLQFGVRFFM